MEIDIDDILQRIYNLERKIHYLENDKMYTNNAPDWSSRGELALITTIEINNVNKKINKYVAEGKLDKYNFDSKKGGRITKNQYYDTLQFLLLTLQTSITPAKRQVIYDYINSHTFTKNYGYIVKYNNVGQEVYRHKLDD